MSDRTAPTSVEQEVRAVFARILDAPRPASSARSLAEAEANIAASPSLAASAAAYAALRGADDATTARLVPEFLTAVHNEVAVILLAAYPGMRADVLAGGAR